MSTKLNPGTFDCYANALPDEPMFVLLARDPVASSVVLEWIDWRNSIVAQSKEPTDREAAKWAEADACITAMRAWRTPENLARVEAAKSATDRPAPLSTILTDAAKVG